MVLERAERQTLFVHKLKWYVYFDSLPTAMLRLFTLTMLCWLVGSAISAQPSPAGNEWITYSQSYYKIPIVQSGLYRITSLDLQKRGVVVQAIDPKTIQLFHRGKEQAIQVVDETDGRFDPDDYIEFYGRGNDGFADSALYRNDADQTGPAQPHSYYSLFSDTTAYFLTWRPGGPAGRRMVTATDTVASDLNPVEYHWAEELRLFTDTYPGYAAGIPPKLEYSHYEPGEGHTGVILQTLPYVTSLLLPNAYRSGPPPQIDILLTGRDYTAHRVEGRVGPAAGTQRLFGSATFSLYGNAHLRDTLSWQDVGSDNQLLVSTAAADGNRYSLSYLRLRYPQRLTANNQPVYLFRLPPHSAGRSRLVVLDVPATARFFDITDPNVPTLIQHRQSGTTARLIVPGSDRERIILCSSQVDPIPAIRPVTFVDWRNRRPTYLIVTHENLMQPTARSANAVRAYAAYRASVAGGGFDTLTVTMAQLIDQYSYGERHPLAIRRFVDQLLRQSRASGAAPPEFLLLLGRSRSAAGVRHNPDQAGLDLVMTMGFPSSDAALTAGLDGALRDVPRLPTGRINAATPDDVLAYLNKVIEYEQLPSDTPWRKQLLHLSGGTSPDESRLFRSLVDAYGRQATRAALGARVATVNKQTTAPTEDLNIAPQVNEGLGLITFFGHAGLSVTDLNIGFCSDDALGYRNRGRYPVLLINGCAIGNFFFGRPTLTTDWILTPERGAIAAIAQSHLGYVNTLDQYSTVFYDLLTDSTWLDRSIGQLQQETIRRILTQTPTGLALANAQQMVLQGDPAIRPFPFPTPDYGFVPGGLRVEGTDGAALTSASDSVTIRLVIQNTGRYQAGRLPIRIRRFVQGRESGVYNLSWPGTVAYRDTISLTIPNERTTEGANRFDLSVNPADRVDAISEVNRTNNQLQAELPVPGQLPRLIYPPMSAVVAERQIRLIAQPFGQPQQLYTVELDTSARFTSPGRLSWELTAQNGLSVPATLTGPAPTRYFWRVRPVLPAEAPWQSAQFTYHPAAADKGLPEGQVWLSSAIATNDLRQGDSVAIPVSFANLSPHPFQDSLVVQQVLYGPRLPQPQLSRFRIKAPAPGDTTRFTVRVPTVSIPGLNRLMMTVNPSLQAEYSLLNNTLDLPLPVQADQLAPLLEVAFDGTRINEGAVVSANPVLDILVADDNRSLRRRDTTGMALLLQRPGQLNWERLGWTNARIQPAGADNVFRVRYQSASLAEGDYGLIATAQDAVGNAAVPYRTRFRVVRTPALTDFTAYPNPFRDQVVFSFSLTGEGAPNEVQLIITDLMGRPVRHLRSHTPGRPARVGLNEWVWDGHADTGEDVPAGVYIYRLVINDGWVVPAPPLPHGRLVRVP